jgi:hypothetical protein
MFHALWEVDFRSFHSLNGAIMILLHKTEASTGLRDYRPINLIHSIGKLFAKGLALCLAPRMSHIVKDNQSAFIQGCRIHENFRTVLLACHRLNAQWYQTILLKVDLAKAFETVAWLFLLEVLEHIGFPLRWRDWISVILGSSSTKVLVNGHPGHRICHARGLRQGDPLSPFLSIIVMEVLNTLIAEADRHVVLTPLPDRAVKCQASVYADDLVVFLHPPDRDFNCIW